MEKKIELKSSEKHIPVLLHELISSIQTENFSKNIVVDATLGMGGHATEILKKLKKGDVFIGLDADSSNLEMAKQNLVGVGENVEKIFIHTNYGYLSRALQKNKIENITAIYYDLGLSSVHLDEAQKGFSFRFEGPLDMRLDQTHGKTAAEIVNSYSETELTNIFLKYGEETKSKIIAKKIVSFRQKSPFTTTKQLSELIEEVSFQPQTKARIFQALRIEVNKEIYNLERSLESATKLLNKGGDIFVISFHSLEDRCVKQFFKKESSDCICSDMICTCHHTKTLEIMHKKPILPSPEEMKNNPRSKSAKARWAKKL